MTQIVLDIDDKELKAKLFSIAQDEHTDINHIAFDAIKAFVGMSEDIKALSYPRLNPLEHMEPIKFDALDGIGNVTPFEAIDDPADYIHNKRTRNLRQKMDIIFVDSCVVIDFSKNIQTVTERLSHTTTRCMNFIVEMELLQGARNKKI